MRAPGPPSRLSRRCAAGSASAMRRGSAWRRSSSATRLSSIAGSRARETALARVRALRSGRRRPARSVSPALCAALAATSPAGRQTIPCRRRASRCSPRISQRLDAQAARRRARRSAALGPALPLGGAATCRSKAQEMLVSLLIEPHGALVDDLADEHGHRRGRRLPHRRRACACRDLAATHRAAPTRWALATDFSQPAAQRALLVRVGGEARAAARRARHEPGAELEQPLAVARDVASLCAPRWREPRPTRRLPRSCCGRPSIATPCAGVQISARHPYGEDPRQPDRRRHARHRSAALQARFLRRHALRPAVGPLAAHHPLPGRAVPRRAARRRLGRLDLGRAGRSA